jgi:hypothetical protein
MWYRRKENGIIFTLKSKQETRCLISIICHRLQYLDEQIKSGKIKENIHQLKGEEYKKEFARFAEELIENLNADL